MNKQPVLYLQTDPRWKNEDYSAKGESTTIGASGCGPTAAAMLIETLTGKVFTPSDACKWSLEHGYKAVNQGTYYAYFPPQFAAHGISCYQLNWTTLYHNPNSTTHDKAFDLLKQGHYLIALMKKGNWTSGGHFVVVWWEDGKVRINDPASTRDVRVNGDIRTFRNECAYYWVVDARDYNKEEPDMTEKQTKEIAKQVVNEINPVYAGIKDVPSFWQPSIQELLDMDILNGGTSKEVNPADVNLSRDTIKAIVLMKAYIDKKYGGEKNE